MSEWLRVVRWHSVGLAARDPECWNSVALAAGEQELWVAATAAVESADRAAAAGCSEAYYMASTELPA